MTIETVFTLTTLTVALATGTRFLPAFQTTLITGERTATGGMLADPIHTPRLELRPRNSVAEAIGPGEALRCETGMETKEAWVDQMVTKVNTIVLNCDGAKFAVEGILFEGDR